MNFLITNNNNKLNWEYALGAEHYSWKRVSQKFEDCFDRNRIKWKYLDNPHHINDRNIKDYGIKKNDVCLSFRPFDQIRICKSTINIAHLAWEFPTIKDPITSEITSDFKGNPNNKFIPEVLKSFDQIWAGSKATETLLSKNLEIPVHYLPAPIYIDSEKGNVAKNYIDNINFQQLSKKIRYKLNFKCYPVRFAAHKFEGLFDSSTIKSTNFYKLINETKNKSGKIFGAVFNPHDARKNIEHMVRGFSMASSELKNSILILKLSTKGSEGEWNSIPGENKAPHKFIYNELFYRIIETHAVSFKNIYFISDFIPDEDMAIFYKCFDYYLCTSRCEGQNLPLKEAMMCGVVPISVDNTSMADYINEENSFIINSYEEKVDFTNHNNASFWGLDWSNSDIYQIADTLINAAYADKKDLQGKSNAAKNIIKEYHSDKMIMNKIKTILNF